MTFEINLERRWFTGKSTVGVMYYAFKPGEKKQRACYTLEDQVRPPGVKIHGETAIPVGKYRIVASYSDRFRQIMPELLNVEGFSGVRIHVGNKPEDTQGCILIGRTEDDNYVGESKLAYAAFCRRFCEALNAGEEVWMTIHGSPFEKGVAA